MAEINRLSPTDFSKIIDAIEYQKTYLFRIQLPQFEGNDGSILTPSSKFEFCTSSTATPVMSSQTQNMAFYNSELKIATKTSFSNWSANFKLDVNKKAATFGITEGWNSYQYFYLWHTLVFDTLSRVSFLPEIYKKDITLFLLDEFTNPTDMNFKLEGAFPVQISGGNLDYSQDSIFTYTVDFAFDRYILEGLKNG